MANKVLSAILFVFVSFTVSAAEGLDDLAGVVTDSAGAAIAGASVELAAAQQLVLAVTETDDQGRYSFSGVADGSYVVRVSRDGFSSNSRPLNLRARPRPAADVALSINQLSESVTVTADVGRVEEVAKVPQQLNIVSRDAITQRASSVLAQVADEETGVSLQRTSPTIGAVLVRGLTEVAVYVDGVRYTNATQRGGINTFFNLNEPTTLRTIEIQRSPNTAQFGSDGLGGNVQLLTRQPEFRVGDNSWNGEFGTGYTSSDHSYFASSTVGYGTDRFAVSGSGVARRVNTLRPGGGIDSHSAITRFLGLPSNIIGSQRLPDTAFTQYGGTLQMSFAPTDDQNFSFRYQRSQQDGGKRYDQLLGGDGNLVAELKNLMLDFGYLRFYKQKFFFFDSLSANVSYNSQREERQNQGGQGNPIGAITYDKERTSTFGFSFYADTQFARNSFLVGGDFYHDRVDAPSYNLDPATGITTRTRPRVPDGSTYDLGGLYVQDVWDAIPDRLRVSGSLRYNVAKYKSPISDIAAADGTPLFPADSARFNDFSGRIGASVTIAEPVIAAFNFSRGFRAPNITGLGGLGLVGAGFQVSTTDVAGLGATIGTTADGNAVSSGVAVSPLRSETSNSFDFSLRFKTKRFSANAVGFLIDYKNAIVRQTLILPQGAAGLRLGSQTITSQSTSGAVFVPASINPVLVQSNFGDTRLKGAEFNFEYRFTDDWMTAGNYSYVYAADRRTGEPPNLGGGGIPPQFAFLRLRYQPAGKDFWVEGYANGAGRQSRLSSLDLTDRRTGAARSRAQIQNFFRRGACVRGITANLSGTGCGTTVGSPNYRLLATGETIAHVQNRLLPLNTFVNGVFVANNDTVVPMFRSIPGYLLLNVRGGYRFGENHEVTADFENLLDKSHRAPGWGIDGPGRSISVRYRYTF